MNGDNHLAEMETLFLALADRTRLRLLNLMREDEVCVCYFTEVLGESQPKISRHLAYLRHAGLVAARRDGKWIHYRLVFPGDAAAARTLRETLAWLGRQGDLQKDYEKLAAVCAAMDGPVTTARAPTPQTFVKANTKDERPAELEIYLL